MQRVEQSVVYDLLSVDRDDRDDCNNMTDVLLANIGAREVPAQTRGSVPPNLLSSSLAAETHTLSATCGNRFWSGYVKPAHST